MRRLARVPKVWEAFHFAYAHKLDNLIYIIDNNGYQLDGKTADIVAAVKKTIARK